MYVPPMFVDIGIFGDGSEDFRVFSVMNSRGPKGVDKMR